MKKFLIKAFLRLFSWLPLSVHHFNAHILGWIARCVVRYRTKIVKDNIDKAFPEKTPQEKKKIFKDFYLHFGQIMTEIVWFGGSSKKRLLRSDIFSIKNPEELKRLSGNIKGTIVLFAHCGNWEVLPALMHCNELGLTEKTAANVYKKQTSQVWDEVLRDNRLHSFSKDFNNYIETNNIVRHVLEHQNEGMFWFFCTDQWPYGSAKGYTIVNFMNRKTRSMTAAAALARKLHLAVTYLSIVRPENHKNYIFEFKTIADDASTLTEQQIVDQYYKYIEEDIYADPGNYLWSHRRWKKAPDTQ